MYKIIVMGLTLVVGAASAERSDPVDSKPSCTAGFHTECEREEARHLFAAEKVLGGLAVEDSWYPWQAKLKIQTPKGTFSCGGSLIAPQWVLTAAHCLVREGVGQSQAQDVSVDLGTVERNKLQYPYAVQKIITHPQYLVKLKDNPKTGRQQLMIMQNDIALLRLAEPVTGATFIKLPDKYSDWDKKINHRLKVSGWGKTTNRRNDYGSKRLKITDLSVITPKLCQKHYPAFADKQLCVGDLSGVKDSCNGDSGGPLFRGISLDAVQYGIVSYGSEQCAQKDTPGAYTRVADYVEWIKATIGSDNRRLQIAKEGIAPISIPNNVTKGKRALLIGVNEYYLGGQLNLLGTHNDVANMRDMLIKHFGFLPEQILTLKDSQASADNIRYAVKQWLIKQTGKGDKVWLYFSGHGGFLIDTSGDEVDIDAQLGLPADETIFPYDVDVLTTIGQYSKPNKGMDYLVTTNHILDDEINQWTKALGNRNLTVVFDSCHSGTATRSIGLKRYKSGIYALTGYLGKKVDKKPNIMTQLEPGTRAPLKHYLNSNNMEVWSAVSSSQRAIDTGRGGIFTTAFVNGIGGQADKNSDNDISYSELLDYVRSQSNNQYQLPQLEIAQNRINHSIFTQQVATPPQEVAEQVLTQHNPHNVQIHWTDKQTGQTVTQLKLCELQNPNCPEYQLTISSDQSGWLLLYDLSEKGELQQFFPNRQVEKAFPNQYSGQIIGNQPFVFPFTFTMKDATASQIIAIVLSPEEKANYNRIAEKYRETERASFNFLYSSINRRDRIIGEAEQFSPWSVKILKYQAK